MLWRPSIEAKCIAIGEDLVTVPEGLRETMMDWGLWSYQVMLFERSRKGEFLPPETYREDALVTFATHDLPTFKGWRDRTDLAVRKTLGLATGETPKQRQAALAALRRALRMPANEQTDFAAVARFLARAPPRICWGWPIRSMFPGQSTAIPIGVGANADRTSSCLRNQSAALPVP
jgi:4-alpha-glucanotransferase